MTASESYRGKRVLITGGLGFIGSNIAHQLVPMGARVTIVDSLAPLYGGNFANVEEIRSDITICSGDYRDPSLMTSLLRETDVLFHMAAQVSYIDSAKIPLDDLDINCKGTLQMLEICRQHNPDVRVVFASSRLVLGKVLTQPVREDHPAEPLSLYGVHKLACEEYLRFYARTYGLKTVVLRITNPYGERQQLKHSKYSLPGWFMRLTMEGKPITIFGDGSQLRDYVYGTDIAEAFVSVGATQVPSGEIFNCGFGRSVPFREMVETIVEVLGRGEVKYMPWPTDYERSETGDVNFDVSKIRRTTGWFPAISLKEGVKKMYDFFSSRLDRYI